ncbi:hypothetical protein [Aminipila sp.]|uniref:hypothetical protein n=1 Tax=Aminipila sp. TaxID=2060095 RepID=UPI00289BA246|nr:hypothetical protein [Aminipila sp.]
MYENFGYESAGAFYMIFGAGFLFWGSIYFLLTYGIYRMAKNECISNAWVSFIPYGVVYVMLKLVKDNFTVFGKKIANPQIKVPIFMLLTILLFVVPILNIIMFIICIILHVSINFHVYNKYRPDMAVMLTVSTILVGLVAPIMLFMMRNNKAMNTSYNNDFIYYNDLAGINE